MQNKLFSLIAFFIIIPSVIMAQVDIKGYIQTDTRAFLEDKRFYWNENRLDLQIDAQPSEGAHIYSEIWVRGFGFPEVMTSSDLMERQKGKVQPWDLVFREAYLDLYGFLLPDLDLRIGRQRIAWGTADKLNPTDNLNSHDLEDIWDFGRHLGSNAIKACYYLGDYTLTGVYIPVFTPSVLPTQDWAQALSPELTLPQGLILNNLEDQINTPETTLKNFTAAFKIAKNFFSYDFSMSYMYGWDNLPIATGVTMIPVGMTSSVDIKTTLAYQRSKVLGFDMAGSIGKVGIWAECAVFFPKKVEMVTDLTAFGLGKLASTTLDDESYMRYVIGLDYSFKNGIYLNCQYLHGFIHERGRENLEDYFMFGVEKKLFNDKLKTTPIAGGVEIKDFDEIKDNYAILYGPEIAYYPTDNAEILIGAHIIYGKNTTVFGRVKDNDEVYVKIKYSF
jgi:hypothetical protein